MRRFKNMIFIIVIMFMTGCTKDEFITEQVTTKVGISTSSGFSLGNKLENAYSLDYMRQAYDTLLARGEISSSINISATHLYIRLTPQDSTEMNCILADTVLELFPYPLDYELIGEGEYEVEENATPELYTVIPVEHKLNENIKFGILEECFIPEDYDENPDLAKLEIEALLITGNITKEQLEEENNERGLLW